MKTNLLNFDLPKLTAYFEQIGEKPFRAKQLMRQIHLGACDDFDAMTDIAKSLRLKLQENCDIRPPEIIQEHTSTDGTKKWLLNVDNQNAIETVFIPEENRGTLCVSTQAGCALDCAFCSTGKQGFNRNLSVAEIIGQLWVANRALGVTPKNERVISNVVMMGMGEPLANFDNTVSALKIMLDDYGYGLSRRRVTVSTSGLIPQMERLAQECPTALAVSLHAPNDDIRNKIMPINQKYPLKDLMNACLKYLPHAPRDFITFEYILLGGVNDEPQHAQELLDLVKAVPCKFNLIPFNPFPNSPFRQPERDSVLRFRDILNENGIIATIRKTRGDDIAAACGQLAGQVKDKTRRTTTDLKTIPVMEKKHVHLTFIK